MSGTVTGSAVEVVEAAVDGSLVAAEVCAEVSAETAEADVVTLPEVPAVDCGAVVCVVSAGTVTGSAELPAVPEADDDPAADEVSSGSGSVFGAALAVTVECSSGVVSAVGSAVDGMTKSGTLSCPPRGEFPPRASAAVIPAARIITAAAMNAVVDFFKNTPALYGLPERLLTVRQDYCTSKEVICQSIASAPVNPPAWAEVMSAPMMTPFSTRRCASMGTGSSSVRLTS